MTISGAHAALGASAAHRWMRCPGSIRLSDGIEAPASTYAEEGAAAHVLAKICLDDGSDALALIEQSGLPSFADAMAQKPPQCHRTENALYAWVVRDAAPAGANAGEGRLRALLLVTCGLVEGREGSFPSSAPQLLVYGDDGRLDVVAGTGYAAALDWQTGSDGPKLAHATVSGFGSSDDRDVEAVAGVVATK